MKTSRRPKLNLAKESLRRLQSPELERAIGGDGISGTTGTAGCTNQPSTKC